MRRSTLLWIISGFLVLFNIVVYLTHWGGNTVILLVSDFLPVLCSFIAIIALYSAFRAFKEFDFTKTTWLMLLIGVVFNFIAETTYAILEVVYKQDMNNTFPSFADFFWCGGYIPFFIGLSMMLLGYKKGGFPFGNTKFLSFLILLIVLVSVTVFYFVLIPVITDPETGLLTKIFSLFYPIADVFTVIPAVLIVYVASLFGKATISRPWRFMACGFICFTVADLLYSYLSWRDLYGNGNLIDVAWHAGYLLIGLAGFYQRELIESLKEGR